MVLLSIIVFAVALSCDGLAVGVSYGIRKISIPFGSVLVIFGMSASAMGVSMFLGHLISGVISLFAAKLVGALILIGVGCWVIVQSFRSQGLAEERSTRDENPESRGNNPSNESDDYQILKIRIHGLIIQILRDPEKADRDRSGTISKQEALLLSLALSVDAFAAGFGAAMAGFKYLITPFIVGLVQIFMVTLGVRCGRSYAPVWISGRASLVQGGVLVLLGLLRLVVS